MTPDRQWTFAEWFHEAAHWYVEGHQACAGEHPIAQTGMVADRVPQKENEVGKPDVRYPAGNPTGLLLLKAETHALSVGHFDQVFARQPVSAGPERPAHTRSGPHLE